MLLQLQFPPAPQPIVIAAAAAPEDLDSTFKYVIDEGDAQEVASNAIILVDPVAQTSSPPSAAALPNPFLEIRVKGFFSAYVDSRSIVRVFKADARPHPPPSPPPTYADSAPQTCRQPLPSLFSASRPRTRSAAVDGSLLGPLEGNTRYFLLSVSLIY